MKKMWVIIKREYLTRVKKRSFLISTLLVPLLITAFYAAMILLATGQGGASKKSIAVVDESGQFLQKFRDSKAVVFKYPKGTLEEVKASSKEAEYTGILHIPTIDIYKPNDNITYFSDGTLGLAANEYIENQLRRRIKDLRMEDQQIDKELLESLEVDLSLTKEGLFEVNKDQTAEGILSGIGYVMGLLLYFVLFFFGMMVMRAVKEEKTNRIVEVIVSSVKPMQLMFGKIIGISFVGLTQFLIWGFLMYGGYALLLPLMLRKNGIDQQAFNSGELSKEQVDNLPDISQLMYDLANYGGYGELIFYFLFFFLGGYLIYASLFSAVGSAIEDENDAQQLMLPVMMPIIIGVVILSTLFNDPHNPVATWASIIPLTSPIVMPARIPFDPPLWQRIASIVSLVISVFFFVWLSAKIFRVGILMYGKRVNLKEVIKWLRY
ncbi:MAG: ABC transporter permease [Saprospiraceae bacterium]|nr:ABC transporter permease [Saprospiraceae bacterium]